MAEILRPTAFVWCIAGPHIGETLIDIVDRKRRDIDRFGWCLWAYGGMGNAHPDTEVRRLAREYTPSSALPLLMPDTGKKYPDNGVPFSGYRHDRDADPVPLPDGMSPVTGGTSSWAFHISALSWADEVVVDISQYVAPFTRKGRQPLAEYLKGSHGRACAARAANDAKPIERRVHVVADLTPPYAVFLCR